MTRLPAGQLAFSMPETVQSVVRCPTNGPLLAAAAQLWIDAEDLVVDVTYGRGNFWTHYRPAQLVPHDLALDGVDFRHLPEPDRSIDVVVFDPPYMVQGGRETSTVPEFIDRYGLRDVPKSRWDLEELIAGGIKEAARVLRPGGRLLVKCMDYVNGGQFVSGRHHVVSVALAAGVELVDELVHYSGCGPQPEVNLDGSPRRQEHARRAHSFLCVFRARARRSRARVVVLNGGARNPGVIPSSGDASRRGQRPQRSGVAAGPPGGQGDRPLKSKQSSIARLTLAPADPSSSFARTPSSLHRGEPCYDDAIADAQAKSRTATPPGTTWHAPVGPSGQ